MSVIVWLLGAFGEAMLPASRQRATKLQSIIVPKMPDGGRAAIAGYGAPRWIVCCDDGFEDRGAWYRRHCRQDCHRPHLPRANISLSEKKAPADRD
ncbi:hypothetical protein [Neoroseomonas lacus]|uniref:hypothetical protein n=1 Tax=Neoroseomonas lacus TaxID=287609 RepID=UPI001666E9E3|nr:hypothetical protein [Neoroseomonas lacus]